MKEDMSKPSGYLLPRDYPRKVKKNEAKCKLEYA